MASPLNMLGPTPAPMEVRKKGLAKELKMKSAIEDLFSALNGIYTTEKKSIHNAIYMEIEQAATKGSWTSRIPFLYKLREGGVFGRNQAIGEEEQPETKFCDIYRNNCRKVVSTPGYGADKLDAEHIGLFEQHIDNLAEWNKEQEGLEIRQALLETYGETLWHGDTAPLCVKNWNPNVFVAGIGAYDTAQPEYDPGSNVFTTNIATALNSVNSGKGEILTNIVLSNICNYAIKKRITQLDIPGLPGNKGYILMISELQEMYIGDPAWAANNLGTAFIRKAALNEKVMSWPGVLGSYKNLLLVTDPRAATVMRQGNNILNAGYLKHGDVDDRNRPAAGVDATYDVVTILGRGAVWKWEPEKLHQITQTDDYGAVVGTGTACVRGIGIPIYRASETPSDDIEQFTSAICLAGIPGDNP